MSRLEIGIIYIFLSFGSLLVYSIQFILRMKSNKDELKSVYPLPPSSKRRK